MACYGYLGPRVVLQFSCGLLGIVMAWSKRSWRVLVDSGCIFTINIGRAAESSAKGVSAHIVW
jgi:hypothetical protein